MTTVGVVIRCFNEERHIGRLLHGLRAQTRQPDQIVVVDSGSTDATLDIAKEYATDIVHIASTEFSFGRALNIGCAAATTDLLLIASAHVYPVYDSWLERITAPFESADTVCSYGRQIGDQRTKYSESRLMLKWYPPVSNLRQRHPFCNNANAAIRRSLWEQHPYDEDLTGLEDLEWARRVTAGGGVVAYVAEAPVVHVHEETWNTVSNRYRREALAYRRVMGTGQLNLAAAIGLGIGNTLSDYVHAARDGVLLRNLGGIPRFRMAQFIGAYQGSTDRDEITEELRRRFYYPLAVQPVPVSGGEPGSRVDYSGARGPDGNLRPGNH